MTRFYYDAILGLVFWSFGDGNKPNYKRDKDNWVRFAKGQPKMKLRQYIHGKAEHIAEISMGNLIPLKNIFIEAYDLEGLEGIHKVYKETLRLLNKSAKDVKKKYRASKSTRQHKR